MLTETNNDSVSSVDILAVTIIAELARCEVRTIIDHSPELTRNADGETRTIASRSFPRHAACPIGTAQRLFAETRALYPRAIVTLINA